MRQPGGGEDLRRPRPRGPDQVTNIHDLMVEAFEHIDARLEGTEGTASPPASATWTR